jgi:hypothetical protein
MLRPTPQSSIESSFANGSVDCLARFVPRVSSDSAACVVPSIAYVFRGLPGRRLSVVVVTGSLASGFATMGHSKGRLANLYAS